MGLKVILQQCFFIFINGMNYIYIIHFFSTFRRSERFFNGYSVHIRDKFPWSPSMIAIISFWVECLYILRKSPCGLYILMLWKILKTFINMCFIWISTLICFSSLFGLIIMQTRMINKYHCEQEKRKNVILSMFNDSFVNNNGDHLSTCNKDIGGDIWEEAVSLQKLFRYEFV